MGVPQGYAKTLSFGSALSSGFIFVFHFLLSPWNIGWGPNAISLNHSLKEYVLSFHLGLIMRIRCCAGIERRVLASFEALRLPYYSPINSSPYWIGTALCALQRGVDTMNRICHRITSPIVCSSFIYFVLLYLLLSPLPIFFNIIFLHFSYISSYYSALVILYSLIFIPPYDSYYF